MVHGQYHVRYFDCTRKALEESHMKTVLFAGVVFAFAASGLAQDRPAPTANSSGQQDRQVRAVSSSGSEDIEFVLDAAKGGMAEVELGKLAAEHAKNDEVKKFAQRMVDDHSKAGDELKSIAERKGIKLPQDIDAKDKALMNRLQKLNGAAFDRAYMQAMVGDHVKDVNEFKKEANSGRDPQVKSFASTTLPTLEEHLQHARQARTAATSSTAAGN
jgi:putative membrane protein